MESGTGVQGHPNPGKRYKPATEYLDSEALKIRVQEHLLSGVRKKSSSQALLKNPNRDQIQQKLSLTPYALFYF
jgi:hypothetical protein